MFWLASSQTLLIVIVSRSADSHRSRNSQFLFLGLCRTKRTAPEQEAREESVRRELWYRLADRHQTLLSSTATFPPSGHFHVAHIETNALNPRVDVNGRDESSGVKMKKNRGGERQRKEKT